MADDYVMFRLSNKGILVDSDPNNPLSGAVPDVKRMGDFNRILNAMENRIRSATGEVGFKFNRNLRYSDASNKYQYQDVVLAKDFYPIVLDVLKGFEASMNLGSHGIDLNTGNTISNTYLSEANAKDAVKIELTKTMKGRKAQIAFKKEALQSGGFAEAIPTLNNPERMKATVFIPQSEYALLEANYKAGGSTPETALFNQLFPSAKKESSFEGRKRRAVEKEEAKKKAEIAFEKERKESDALTVFLNKEMAKAKADEQKKIEEEEKKEAKEALENKAKRNRTLGKILATIILVADITRRILTAVLSYASKVKEDSRLATSLGLDVNTYRNMQYQDMSHGLERGTQGKALQTIQSKFGDVTNLDSKSLDILARVMGASITDMVKSGMGGKEPDKLLESIIDSFFKQFMLGKNSLGQNVGQYQALRELTTVLSKISPELSTIFSAMANDWISSNGVSGNTLSSWNVRNTDLRTGLITPYDLGVIAMAGGEVNKLKSSFTQLVEQIEGKVITALSGFITALNNSTIGMSPAEKEIKFRENKEKAIIASSLNAKRYTTAKSDLESALLGTGIDFDESWTATNFIQTFGLANSSSYNLSEEERLADAERVKKQAQLLYEAKYGTTERGLKFRQAVGAMLYLEGIMPEVEKNATSNTGSIYNPEWTNTSAYASLGVKAMNEALERAEKNRVMYGAGATEYGTYEFLNSDIYDIIHRTSSYGNIGESSLGILNSFRNKFMSTTANKDTLSYFKNANKNDSLLLTAMKITGMKKSDLIKNLGTLGESDLANFMNEVIFTFIKNMTSVDSRDRKYLNKADANAMFKNMFKGVITSSMEQEASSKSATANIINDAVVREIVNVSGATRASAKAYKESNEAHVKLDVTFYDEEGKMLGTKLLSVPADKGIVISERVDVDIRKAMSDNSMTTD